MTLSSSDSFPATAVLVASGGLDSTALAYHLQAGGVRLVLLSFDYGQRHRRELDFAATLAARLSTRHYLVDLRSVGALLSGNALTDMTVAVPDGHYTAESMSITVVPNIVRRGAGCAVTDFGDLAAFQAYLDENFDHRLLNEVLDVEPTSELLAEHFYGWCVANLEPVIEGRLAAVRVSETPSSWAEFRGDS